MPMIICTKCKQEMTCNRTGVTVTWNHTHRRSSDEFKCSDCGALVCVANDKAYRSDGPIHTTKHLEMLGENGESNGH